MKQIMLLFAFVCAFSFAAQAQCPYAAKANAEAAAKLASSDEAIESRTCAKSGTVSYVRKSVCPASGKVSYTDVKYDSAQGAFINVSPSAAQAKATSSDAKKSCNPAACKGKKKAACTDKAKATSASVKMGCDPAACKKSKTACTGKKASLAKSEASPAKATLVKQEQ